MINYIGFLRLKGQYTAMQVEFDENNALLDENAPASQLLAFTRVSDSGNDKDLIVNLSEIAFLEYWEKK